MVGGVYWWIYRGDARRPRNQGSPPLGLTHAFSRRRSGGYFALWENSPDSLEIFALFLECGVREVLLRLLLESYAPRLPAQRTLAP